MQKMYNAKLYYNVAQIQDEQTVIQSMYHFFGLYQLVKTERRIFQCNRNELELALSKRKGCESIYGYKLTNVNIKKVISVSVFLLQNKRVDYMCSFYYRTCVAAFRTSLLKMPWKKGVFIMIRKYLKNLRREIHIFSY